MAVRRGLLSILVFLLAALAGPLDRDQPAAAASTTEVIALVVEGVGNGHGRGMSQWGSYGRAVNGGQTWTQILAAYYGGTTLSTVASSSRVRVRLTAHDGAQTVGVISSVGRAMWGGVGYGAVQARPTGTANRYDVYTSPTAQCPGATTTGWTLRSSNVAGPIDFSTSVGELTAAPGDVLGLCTGNEVVHYRGLVQLTRDSAGATRVVNDVNVEGYLRGVISREVSTSWGDAGGGAGMNALRAQAVAARSYALAQNRYASSGGYATTCDTTACQYYGGAARRTSATAPTSSGGTCESGNTSFECVNTNRAVTETAGRVLRWPDGRIVSTEYSASNGPRTAGGSFPAIDDPYDDVSGNRNHRWTRVIDAHVLANAYGLGMVTAARTESDPTVSYDGVWDNRVRVSGTASTAVISALTLRSTFGLPSHGFTIQTVTRGVSAPTSMRLIGDSVGLSMTESSTAELPALLDGVFASAAYDAVQNRCTSDCGLSGVGAAASVPLGTDLVVVELGYNTPTSSFGTRIDRMMTALRARQVDRVVWINLAERSGRADYVAVNQALTAARARWPELYVLDWRTASAGSSGNRSRWFSADGIHLSATGQAEMARFVRSGLLPLADFTMGDSLLSWDHETGTWAIWTVHDWQLRQRSTGRWSSVYDALVIGDFDRDGRLDDMILWDITTGNWVIHSWQGYASTYRGRGTFSYVYDKMIVGDFDADGYVNDLMLWDQDSGLWVMQEMAGFRPTYRGRGSWSRVYDVMVVGDWDDSGRRNDAMLWDRDSGLWVVQQFSSFRPTYRGRGTWSTVYDRPYVGDFIADGRLDDMLLWDDETGNVVLQSWWRFAPVYRGRLSASSTMDDGAGADLDGDGRVDDLLVFDGDAGEWQMYRWQNYAATLTRAGTWSPNYDVVVVGELD